MIDTDNISLISLNANEDALLSQYNLVPTIKYQSKDWNSDRMNPFALAEEQSNTWSNIDICVEDLAHTYNKVKATGLPNLLGAKIPLFSSIKIEAWDALVNDYELDDWLVQMLCYGFLLQYTGSVPKPSTISNHSSPVQYPEQFYCKRA